MDIIEVASILAQGSPIAVILLLLLIISLLLTGKVVTKGQMEQRVSDCKEQCSYYEKRADKYERLFIATNVVNDRLLEVVED